MTAKAWEVGHTDRANAVAQSNPFTLITTPVFFHEPVFTDICVYNNDA